MKSFIDLFDLLVSPFNVLGKFFLFLKSQLDFQRGKSKISTHYLKSLVILPLLLFSLVTVEAMADDENENNTCPGEELTIVNGSNIFGGEIESNGVDYYQITVPANGTISIRWENNAPAAKEASLWIGSVCDGSDYYEGNTTSTFHEMNTTAFDQNDTIFIKIYNGEGKDYLLTIYYEVDPTSLGDYDTPTFCYDYSYRQGLTLLNEAAAPPSIEANLTSTSPDVDINLYIKNLGNIADDNTTSYLKAENVVIDIIDINDTGEAIYSRGTTYLKKPGAFYREYISDTELTVSDSYIQGIEVGDVGTLEFFSVDFSVTPQQTELNFPLQAKISYDLAVLVDDTYLLVPQEIFLQNISMCESNVSGYTPAYSIFNVEHNALSSDNSPIYNLPTQTAMRVDDLIVASYYVDNIHTRNEVGTIIGIELIDGNKYGNIIDSCAKEDSAISPRITTLFLNDDDTNTTQVPFDKNMIQAAIDEGYVSDQILNPGGSHITSASEFYSVAKENAAFRIIYNTLNSGDLIQIEEGINGGYRIANFPNLVQEYPTCKQPVKNPNNETITDQTAVACSNAGQSSTIEDLAICMECIYGYTTRYLCSRDNFAIRPESFRVSLSDQDQTSPAIQSHIKTNLNDDQINIVAGYQYTLEVNATNYLNDDNTLGYDQFFELNTDNDKYFGFVWQHSAKDSFCNDISDHNKSKSFKNGELVLDKNISNAEIGEYELEIFDRHWTRYDHDAALLTHHVNHPVHGNVDAYFNDGIDCDANVTTVPEESYDAGYTVSGCDIKSEHTRYTDYAGPAASAYTSIDTRIYPYKFDLNGSDPITPNIGPYTRTNGQTFVYIDTPPTFDANNTNMSYNMNGTFFAAGYEDIGSLSNFVTGCYAEDVNMALNFTYNSPEPSANKTPFLSYSLKDHNTTDKTDIYRPVPVSGYLLDDHFEVGDHNSSTAPFVIDQNETFFVKPMLGAITMDLGYNFKRDYNNTLNPRYIEFHDFNITYKTNPSNIKADLQSDHQIFGDTTPDHNVTFVYGRAKPSQYFYDDVLEDNIDTPISIVIYCDQDPITCSAIYNISEPVFRKTEEFDWYLSRGHVTTDNDGNITLVASTGGDVTNDNPVAINNSGGVNDPNVNVRATVATRPLDVFIDFGSSTNRWLIYNEDFDAIPSPFYRVRFIGQSDWAGAGDTGHTVDGEASIQKNRRLGW